MSGLGKIIAMNFERARMQLKITVRSNVAVVTSQLKYTFRLKEKFSRAKVLNKALNENRFLRKEFCLLISSAFSC